MLKLKSAFFGLCVSVQAGYGLMGYNPCSANDELLPDFADEVRGISTGSEKSCNSDLAVPGVCFPTRLYSQHAAAYGARLITLVPVQAALLPEINSEAWQKSERHPLIESNEIKVVSRETEKETFFEEGVVSEGKVSGWRAARPREISQETLEFEPGEFSTIDLELILEELDGSLQTVAYQETPAAEEITPLAPPMPSTETDNLAEEHTSTDGLFSSLGRVRLEDAIRPANELPDQLNEGKEHSSKTGTRHNWSSGTWVSFRPRRNTFPFHHNPLYFEDPNLERCGQTSGYFTELTSFAHFAGRIPVLPYMMTVEPPCSLVPAKPDCPTCSEFGPDAYFPKPDEVDLGGASIQAAAVVGLIFLIP